MRVKVSTLLSKVTPHHMPNLRPRLAYLPHRRHSLQHTLRCLHRLVARATPPVQVPYSAARSVAVAAAVRQ